MHYSAKTKGFYDLAIHGDNIPADAVEITAKEHAALLEGQSQGQHIVPDENGFPVLITPEVVPYVPQNISMRQCRLQLIADGVYDQVNSAVATMPHTAQVEYEYATEVQRENQLVPALMAIVGWNDTRADQFFVEAAQL